MSESSAGIVATQVLSVEPGQTRQPNPEVDAEALSDKGFADLIPMQIDDLQNDAASIMLPPGLLQTLPTTGNGLPQLAGATSQFLPGDQSSKRSDRIIASLDLGKPETLQTENKKPAVAVMGANQQADPRQLGTRVELAAQQPMTAIQQEVVKLEADLSMTAKPGVELESAEGSLKLATESLTTPANDRQTGQYALSQSVVVSRENADNGASRANVHVGPRFNHQDWGNAVAARVNWQVGQRIQVAEFSINPPELGPVEVKISVDNDKASVQFNVQHGAVKEALEDALPRLRELMSQSGMSLADSNVSQQSNDPGGELLAQDDGREHADTGHADESEDDQLLSTTVKIPRGLVDDYI